MWRRGTSGRESDRPWFRGDDHPDVATDLNNLALLYKSQGRYSEAEPLFVQCLEILSKALPDNHPYIKTGFNNFRLFVQQVVESGQTTQLSNHPLTQDLLHQLQQE